MSTYTIITRETMKTKTDHYQDRDVGKHRERGIVDKNNLIGKMGNWGGSLERRGS